MSGSLVRFFFNGPPTAEIYTLSLHDALPISRRVGAFGGKGSTGRPRIVGRVRRLGTVVLVTVAAISAASAGRVGAAPPGAGAAPAARVGPRGVIKHVVVIFQENHSFDETLGAFCMIHKG